MDSALYSRLLCGDVSQLVSEEIHPGDGMFKGNMQQYMSCGRDALFNISLALASANAREPKRILDFACGFGRVARHLRAAFPEANLTFSDAMPDATAFCAKAFSGADKPVKKDFSEYVPGSRFGLIWVGSLFTHLTEAASKKLIRLLVGHLENGGVVVFTSHGRYVRERRALGTWPYAINDEQYDAMIHEADSKGYGFTGYGESVEYGISLATLGWWERTLASVSNSEVVLLRERGWVRHQDVIAIKRIS